MFYKGGIRGLLRKGTTVYARARVKAHAIRMFETIIIIRSICMVGYLLTLVTYFRKGTIPRPCSNPIL